MLRALVTGLLILSSLPALAVEQKDIKVAEKWAVVGVIAGTDPKGHDIGIAVLRNQLTKHTYTLAIGDALPNEFGFTLKAVQNKTVVVANGEKQVTLGFAESSAAGERAEDDGHDNRTARFIDNYYRGLSDSPIEIFKAERERADEQVQADDNMGRDGLKLPLRRFGGGFKEDAARSRFDLYRNDSGAGSAEAADDGFLVNYGTDEAPGETSGDEPPVFDADGLREVPSDGIEISE
jgi:hypothetical protein